jgi:hypothetical protein
LWRVVSAVSRKLIEASRAHMRRPAGTESHVGKRVTSSGLQHPADFGIKTVAVPTSSGARGPGRQDETWVRLLKWFIERFEQ